jgi:hypothetical protein
MRRSEKTGYWQDQVEKQKQSGLSQSGYCEQAGIRVHNFYRWKRRLDGETTSTPAKFLKIVSDDTRSSVKRSLDQVRLKFPGGLELEATGYPEISWLTQLVHKLSIPRQEQRR